ncbi:MAG: DNA polymerase domain-containing protein [Firmicutes bacterium]|nr:DNA polymerase domain-containing protein [Bacillota bacterium]
MSKGSRVTVGQRIVELTRLDKILWPRDGYTKADLIQYYAEVAPFLLPHLQARPLTVTRYPDGIDGPSFFQKNAPPHTPNWISICSTGGKRPTKYVVAESPETLMWLANQACIELHPWLSTAGNPGRPDKIVIDLDPDPPAGFAEARRIALIVRDVLDGMRVRGYPKLSGATGVHICIPVVPHHSYRTTSRLAGLIGRILARLLPLEVTTERRVSRRNGRVYVDHLQNLPGKTIVAPYSVRARDGAPVSMPVTWEELETCHPLDFTIKTVPDRVRRYGDRFLPVLTDFQDVSAWIRELKQM